MSVYACSDLHGMFNLYQSIKNSLKPDDIVYYLGDAGDRGPESWKTIKAICEDPQFIYIKGNHEDMLITTIIDYTFQNESFISNYRLLAFNGGEDTFNSALLDPKCLDIIHTLKLCPTHLEYLNAAGQEILLSHAGYTPVYSKKTQSIMFPNDRQLMWDREHFTDFWNEENFENTIVVHGHTPMQYLIEDLNLSRNDYLKKPLWYANNHKVCLDTGAFSTKFCFLLNLDTWEYFEF